MLRYFLLVFLVVGQVFSAQAQDSWDLQRCIDYAIQNNIQIKLQELNEKLTQYQLTQVKAGMFPSLNASGSYAVNWGRTNDPTTFQFVTQRIETNSFNLSSQMTLWSGLRQLNTIKRNDYDLQANSYQTEAVKNSVILNITQAYVQILLSGENKKSIEQQIDISLAQYAQTQKLFKAGVVPEGDLLVVESQLSNDSFNLVVAQNSIDLANLTMKLLLQMDPAEEMVIFVPDVNVFAIEQPSPEGPEAIYDYAVGNQPEILSADFSVKSAERALAVARGLHSPTLSLGVNMRTNYSSFESPPFIERDPYLEQVNRNFNQSVGLTMAIPIFNGLSTLTTVKNARLGITRATYQNEQVRNQLKQNVYQAYTDARAALLRYEASVKNMKAMDVTFKYTQDRFNLGAANALDYSNARSNLAMAEISMINAKYDYLFKLKVLDFYQGKPIVLE